MKGIARLFLGIFGTFAFSWAGLILIPNYQIGHLDPQVDEDGNDPYPAPKSGMAERGARIYAANGCAYCHSQQIRGEYAAPDPERTRDLGQKPKWGERRSAPRDYLFERPILLGKMRLGPDLANIGKSAPVEEDAAPATNPAGSPAPQTSPSTGAPPAASPAAASATPAATVSSTPSANTTTGVATTAANDALPAYSAAWHHRHLYSPRSLVQDSNMPAYHFLYQKRRISGERAADALKLVGEDTTPGDWGSGTDLRRKVPGGVSDVTRPITRLKGSKGDERATCASSLGLHQGEQMNEDVSMPGRRTRQGMDYAETEGVQQVHAAIQREKREPRVGLEPLSLWLIGIYGLAIFFGGAYLGRYSGNFSGDGLDPFGGAPRPNKSGVIGPGGGTQTAELSPAERGKKIFSANCATCHQMSGTGVAGQYPPLAGSEYVNGGTRRLGMIVLKGLQGPLTVKGMAFGSAVMQPWDKTLSDAKIADVLTFIRQEWGNTGGPVAPEGIAALRKELASHPDSFTEPDLKAVPADANLPGGDGPAAKPGEPPNPPAGAGPSTPKT